MNLSLSLWEVNAITEECIELNIDESVDLTDLTLSILNETRTLVLKLKLSSHHVSLCLPSCNPMFAQIGSQVKYVKGSGSEYYL
jgi:hypothetical protein